MTPNPAQIIVDIYDIALILSGLLAFGAIVFGAIKYTLAAGNPSEQHEGREWITQALLGVLLLFGAYLILHTINPGLVSGIELNVPQLNLPAVTENAPPLGTCQGGCQSISQNVPGIQCAKGCSADVRTIETLNCIMRKANHPSLLVTSALPDNFPGHQGVRCHQNGCCIDVVITNYNPSSPTSCRAVQDAWDVIRQCNTTSINEYPSACGGTPSAGSTGGHIHLKSC